MADPPSYTEIPPVLAEDIGRGLLPPSYLDVIGQYETSVGKANLCELPVLSYIDIMPRILRSGNLKGGIAPKFEDFCGILEGANAWLRANPGLQVWKCETVERKVENRQGANLVDLDSMFHKEASAGFICYVFGLRLWLKSKPTNVTEIQEIGLINIVPRARQLNVGLVGYGMSEDAMFVGAMNVSYTPQGLFSSYVGLKETLGEFNESTKSKPIPGTIMNVESTTLKNSEENQNQDLDTLSAASSYSFYNKHSLVRRHTQIMRVYYIKGPPTTPQIKAIEFLPEQLTSPKVDPLSNIKWGPFSQILDSATEWMQCQRGIEVVNIETRDTIVRTSFNSVDVNTDATDSFHFGLNINKIRFLRIFYVDNPLTSGVNNITMTSKIFMPLHLGGNSFETMTQTMDRINSWINAAGVPVMGVDTMSYLRTGKAGVDPDRSSFKLMLSQARDWLTVIRVFFPTVFTEPPENLLPSLSSKKEKTKSSACNIL